MGVTLTSIDRALAQIDRLLAEVTFELPAGGPVVEDFQAPFCWADWVPGSGLPALPSAGGYYCGWRAETGAGLCWYHHVAIIMGPIWGAQCLTLP